jgi:hypothetical protein
MPNISLATEFLASSLLTILLPLGLLIAIAIWYVISVRRVPKETPVTSATLPPPEVVAAAAPPPTEDPPGGPPAGQP